MPITVVDGFFSEGHDVCVRIWTRSCKRFRANKCSRSTYRNSNKIKNRKHQQSRYIATVIRTMHRQLLTVISLCSYETDDLFVSFLMWRSSRTKALSSIYDKVAFKWNGSRFGADYKNRMADNIRENPGRQRKCGPLNHWTLEKACGIFDAIDAARLWDLLLDPGANKSRRVEWSVGLQTFNGNVLVSVVWYPF